MSKTSITNVKVQEFPGRIWPEPRGYWYGMDVTVGDGTGGYYLAQLRLDNFKGLYAFTVEQLAVWNGAYVAPVDDSMYLGIRTGHIIGGNSVDIRWRAIMGSALGTINVSWFRDSSPQLPTGIILPTDEDPLVQAFFENQNLKTMNFVGMGRVYDYQDLLRGPGGRALPG